MQISLDVKFLKVIFFFRGVLFLFIFLMWILHFDPQDLKEQDSGLGCTMSLVIWLSFGFEGPNTISTQAPQKSKFVRYILARKIDRFLDWFQYFHAYFGCLRPRRFSAADQFTPLIEPDLWRCHSGLEQPQLGFEPLDSIFLLRYF